MLRVAADLIDLVGLGGSSVFESLEFGFERCSCGFQFVDFLKQWLCGRCNGYLEGGVHLKCLSIKCSFDPLFELSMEVRLWERCLESEFCGFPGPLSFVGNIHCQRVG